MGAFVRETNASVGPQLTLLVSPEEYAYSPLGAHTRIRSSCAEPELAMRFGQTAHRSMTTSR